LLTVLNSTFDALAHEVLSLGLSVAFAGWTALGAALHGRVFKRDALEASGGYEYAASRERSHPSDSEYSRAALPARERGASQDSTIRHSVLL
jgi:hypothetical protein